MELIDTHSHIYDEAFDTDRKEAVDRALANDVRTLILPGINMASYGPMLECADNFPGIAFPCTGLHPTEVNADWEQELAFVREHLHDRSFLAIGEIGLDFYWSRDFESEQRRVLAEQFEIAAKEDLPVLIHCRNATDAIFEVLSDMRGLNLKGIFHAFSGSYETYCRCLNFGDFKFGIGGVCTYKKAGIADILPKMSLADLVLETDCPWLTPVPYRGKRNESSYVRIIAERLALLKGLTLEEVASGTTYNARKLFKI